MGLYSVFLGLGQIIGQHRWAASAAPGRRASTAIFVASFVLLAIAVLPLQPPAPVRAPRRRAGRLPARSRRVADAADAGRARPRPRPRSPAAPAAPSSRRTTSRPSAGPRGAGGGRPRRGRGDRDQRGAGRRDAQRLRHRRRRVLAGLGRGGGRAGRAQRVRAGAGRRRPRRRCGPRAWTGSRSAGRCRSPCRAPSAPGPTRTGAGAGCRATPCSPRRSSRRRPASRRGTG